MRTLRFILFISLCLLPVGVSAQGPLDDEPERAIVEHLGRLMDPGDSLNLDPSGPVLAEMRVWSADAITGEMREVPFEQTLVFWKEYGRIDARMPAYRPDGELAGIIINTSQTRNREGYWNHLRDSIEILGRDGKKPKQIAFVLDFERNRIRQMLRQGLWAPKRMKWEHLVFTRQADSWESVWQALDGSQSMRVTGRGFTPRELLVDTVSFRDADADAWALKCECIQHCPVLWADVMMATEYVMYHDGAEINRIRIDSIEPITEAEFELAVQTPDPESGRLPADVSQVVSSRGLHTTTWVQNEQGQVFSESKLNYGPLIVRLAVVLSCVMGSVLAIVWWRRRADA